jgi:hypothetical protein
MKSPICKNKNHVFAVDEDKPDYYYCIHCDISKSSLNPYYAHKRLKEIILEMKEISLQLKTTDIHGTVTMPWSTVMKLSNLREEALKLLGGGEK